MIPGGFTGGGGGGAETVTFCEAILVSPKLLVAVSLMVNVPAVLYVCVPLVAVWVVPSPKSKTVLMIGFTPGVQLPVTVTLSGVMPVVGDACTVHDGGVLVAALISP